MKKNILILASLALIAAVSCNKEEAGSENSATQTPETASSIEFTAIADGDATRTTLNGLNVEWVEYDEISINGVQFITEDSGPSAVFKLSEESDVFVEADEYIAVYPYSSDNSDDYYGNYLNISENIFAEAGNIPNAEVVSIAKSTNNELYFKNLSSMIKFKVPADFAEPITEITISADQQMSRYVYFGWDEAGNPTWTSDEDDWNNVLTITCVDGSFDSDAEYYIPILPGEKTNFTVRINGYLSATKPSCTFTRSTIHNLGTLPTPEASAWKVMGTSSWDYSSAVPMYVKDNMAIAKNVTIGSGGFKFSDGTNWMGIGAIEAGKVYTNTWNGDNMTVAAEAYDIYLSKEMSLHINNYLGFFFIVPSGTDITEAQLSYNYGLIGNNNDWSDGSDVTLTFDSRGYFVVNNITMSGSEFKIRENGGWANSWGTGGAVTSSGSTIYYNGANSTIASGSYDIYTDFCKIWAMPVGEYPTIDE